MTPVRRYVSDAHALVFHLDGDPRLSAPASAAFDEAERGDAQIVVPIIALAEIAWLVEKGKLDLKFEEILTAIRRHPSYAISPLDESRLECLVKTTGIAEMHDRFIVCETMLNDATLITADREIRGAGIVPVVW
ncbi:MAG: hypothetical protein HY897_14055 [Deltaproteobacteria bacterium]|nr:hypothetical protein [Deltaproteobacteria bacterium]